MKKTKPVLHPLTDVAKEAIEEETVVIGKLPFLVGREFRYRMVDGEMRSMERRKTSSTPNNDLYLVDREELLNVSRNHFQIEKNVDGAYELVDRGSRCGTIVDDKHVGGDDSGGRCLLQNGSTIIVGTSQSPFVFRFEIPE